LLVIPAGGFNSVAALAARPPASVVRPPAAASANVVAVTVIAATVVPPVEIAVEKKISMIVGKGCLYDRKLNTK
jgi:hypothetical protein